MFLVRGPNCWGKDEYEDIAALNAIKVFPFNYIKTNLESFPFDVFEGKASEIYIDDMGTVFNADKPRKVITFKLKDLEEIRDANQTIEEIIYDAIYKAEEK